MKTIVVVNESLSAGRSANVAAVLAVAAGAGRPGLCGPDTVDAEGQSHRGIANHAIAILSAPAERLSAIYVEARRLPHYAQGTLAAIAFPAFAKVVHDYDAYLACMAARTLGETPLDGILLSGPQGAVSGLTGDLRLLR